MANLADAPQMLPTGSIARRAKEALSDPGFQSELHRLLWIEPLWNQGELDVGWSCRDHAIIVATFLAASGVSANVVHGKCMFVDGPAGHAPPLGVGQTLDQRSGHTWLAGTTGGIVDLSPNPIFDTPAGRRVVQFSGIVFDQWRPRGGGRLIRCTTPNEYEMAISSATFAEGTVSGIYFEQRREQINLEAAVLPSAKIDSPLSHRVYRDHGPYAYLAAVLHLAGFVGGTARGVAGVSHNKAWNLVVEQHPQPLEALAKYSGS